VAGADFAGWDLEPDTADPPAVAWSPAPAPSALALLGDSARCRAASAASTLGHPVRLARVLASAIADTAGMLRVFSGAPRTSLNALPGATRRIRAVHLDLERARAVAHAHGAKVNDVVLAVVAGGVRALLSARGELLDGMELKVSVPAALRRADTARELGNAVGVILVSLPASEPDAVRRLETIAAATRAVKAAQHPAYVQGLMGWLAATGLSRPLVERQRMVNFFVTNVPGPRDALYVLGARIEDVMPVTGLACRIASPAPSVRYERQSDGGVR